MYSVYADDSELKVTTHGANNGTRLVPAGTILILVRGSMLFKRVPVCITTREVTFNQDVKALVPKSSIDSWFLLYALLSHDASFLGLVEPTGIGAGKLSTDKLFNFELLLPPLAEQRAIAAILSTWDEAITLTERLIAALQTRKRGLMQRLLTGEMRFPEFEGEEWEEHALEDICISLESGGTPSTQIDDFWTGDIPWITGADFGDSGITQVRRYITQEAVESSSTKIVQEGDILLVSRTGVGKIAIAPFDIAISQDITGITPNQESVYTVFLFYSLAWSLSKLARFNQGTSINGITRADLKRHRIMLPSLQEQQQIALVLTNEDASRKLLERLLEYLRQQKKGLMQRLLTGEIRVLVD